METRLKARKDENGSILSVLQGKPKVTMAMGKADFLKCFEELSGPVQKAGSTPQV